MLIRSFHKIQIASSMPTKPLPDRIAAIKAKQDKLAERLNALQAKAKSVDRKRDTRRKIIVGGAVLNAMEKDKIFAQHVRTLLAASVGRQVDREAIADLLTPAPSSDGATFTVRYKAPAG